MSSDSESELSVYEILNRSERIVNGSVSLDWRQLPDDLIESLPSRPKSAQKYIEKKHKLDCKNLKNLSVEERPLTFNNCHFHYDQIKDEDDKGFLKGVIEPRPVLPDLKQVFEHIRNDQTENRSCQISDSKKMSISEFEPKLKHSDSSVGFKKEMMKSVHEELCSLSNDLKVKKNKIDQEQSILLEKQRLFEQKQALFDQKEDILAIKEQKLIDKETRFKEYVAFKEKDLSDKSKLMKSSDKKSLEETKLIMLKYEEIIENLTKENKRLQTSLKEMLGTNRNLRIQNKQQIIELDQKELKVQELIVELKNSKERAERLRTITHDNDVKAEKELFKQMKKIIKKESTNKQLIAHTTQTDPIPLIEIDLLKKIEKTDIDDGVIRLIHYLLVILLNENPGLNMYDSIYLTYPRLNLNIKTELSIKAKEYLLRLIIKTIHHLNSFEKHQLSALVYHDLQNFKSNDMNIESMVLCHLIPLIGINQFEVVIAILESLISHLKDDGVEYLVVQDGFDVLLKLCIHFGGDYEINSENSDPNPHSISILASSILTNVMNQAFADQEFAN